MSTEQFNDASTPAFPIGYGQFDTHIKMASDGTPRRSDKAGTAYDLVTSPKIIEMVKKPLNVHKKDAHWFIPSTYAEHDARNHEAQRQHGIFRWLTLDVDDNDVHIDNVAETLRQVVGDAHWLIYSSKSATKEEKKWRALIPLKNDLAGMDFADTQTAFFDLLEEASDGTLIPDAVLARPAQLVYLPNRGDFYEYKINKGAGLLDLSPDHKITRSREAMRAENAAVEAAVQAERDKRDACRKMNIQGDEVSPIEHFNAEHSVSGLLARYGYQQKGASDNWRSPMQQTKGHATRDYGDYWVSLSGSDGAAEIGAPVKGGGGNKDKSSCRFGDAFDLYVCFEHSNDYKAAVRTYAKEAGLNSQREAIHKANDLRDFDDALPQPRSFEELFDAAKALKPGQIEDMEAIVRETAPLSPIRQDTVFRAIKDTTEMTLTTIRAQLSQERDAIPEPDHLDLARMTLDTIGHANVICTNSFVWRWQARGVWTQQDDRAIKQTVQARLDEEAMIDVTANLVSGVTDVFKSDIYRDEHKFNLGNPETVNCLNGELELRDGEWILQTHCRENYRTTQIPVTYDPQADAPLFRAFLEQVFRDDPDKTDKIKCALELMGYTLMSHAQHEMFAMLIGPGANGKSVLLAILEGLAGVENVAGVQPSNFDRSFQRAHLHQKLANIVTELKQGEVIADAELKAITSGEPSTVEHKFKNPFVMRPFATCWFGTNHMPHTRDFSEALFRRATILQFNRTFAKDEQDPQLKGKLLTELPGILKMTLEAYARALVVGFTQPQSSEAAKKEWRLEADQVAQFVDDVCIRETGARATASEVFTAYRDWALSNGISKTMSQKGLRERLTRLGFGADKDRIARYVTGLRVPSWLEVKT